MPPQGNPEASVTRRVNDARRFEESRLEVVGEIDRDVERQIKSGLIDANDLSTELDSEELERRPRQTFKRKVTKMVEVPMVRKVKVPTLTTEVVPVKKVEKIRVKRTVPQKKKKWVDETYTDIEDRPATRMKEVWVKKMVPENFIKKVEVRRQRKIEVDYTDYVEVEDIKEVEVETNEVRQVQGWRVDEVKDTKMVEIEGWQEVELVPRIKDTNVTIERTYQRECPSRRIERRMGTDVVDDADARLDNVDTDSEGEGGEEVTSVGRVDLNNSHRTRPSKNTRSRRSHNFMGTYGHLVTSPNTTTTISSSINSNPHPTFHTPSKDLLISGDIEGGRISPSAGAGSPTGSESTVRIVSSHTRVIGGSWQPPGAMINEEGIEGDSSTFTQDITAIAPPPPSPSPTLMRSTPPVPSPPNPQIDLGEQEGEGEGAQTPHEHSESREAGQGASQRMFHGARVFGLRMMACRTGLTVLEVATGGYAEESGLKPGDCIQKVDGEDVRNIAMWRKALAKKVAGHFLTMVVRGVDGMPRACAVTLQDFDASHYQ